MEENNNTNASPIGMIFGILSLVLSIVGGITFGVIGAGVALVLGVLGIIMSINVKKATNGAKGTGGLVMSILGIVFAAIFAIGCVVCAASVSEATGGATSAGSCYGCVGVRCFAQDTANTIQQNLNSDDLKNAIDNIDWSALDQ